ncbi:MAG: tRNA uridine-5-carboxymethylaminomethyl(34) synthesis GTPase MnmE [Bdellovibrionales bacterium]|nr:tRNA uridine-5-carboxymethylaminomethyl(34) synthesis GTPase MnmE [Bdellovibrionales bacterium]
MFSLERDQDTICAIATSAGAGAIALVRLSGEHSIDVVRSIAPFIPVNPESHKIYYGYLIDPSTQQEVDEVLISHFAKGKSFTGEMSFEISCHGSPLIAQQIINCLIQAGVRLAQKGEFTYRAFKSGRIDLAQAEGVLSVIESQSAIGSRMALRQLRGQFSTQLHIIEDQLTWCLSRLEANLDFAAEFIEFAAVEEILERARSAQLNIQKMISSYKLGRTLRKGLKIALVGSPNVGKSSLLNCLSKQERAIVSPIAGTTRDVIEIDINIDGHSVTFADTAGLRTTQDQIETLGVAKTVQTIFDADVICYIADAIRTETFSLPEELFNIDKPVIHVMNKADLPNNMSLSESVGGLDLFIPLSAHTGSGLDILINKIREFLFVQHEENSIVITSARHYELLSRADEHLSRAIALLIDNASPEFIISEMNEVLRACFEILGKQYDDEVLDRVFKDFCLGK